MTKGFSFYCWDSGGPVSPNDVIRLSGDHECFVTGETIKLTDEAACTYSFAA